MTLLKKSRLTESYNEKTRRSQHYEADLTQYNEKQRATIQKAIDSGILNNSNRTHEFVDMLANISADKGVLFDFINNEKLKNSGFAVKGKTVNGYKTDDGNVALNIDSSKSLNSVVGHEITHILEGTELYSTLQEVAKQYAEAKGEYATRMQSLRELYTGVYKGTDFDTRLQEELTADIVGDYLFTDSDFVNNLSIEQPGLFKKIYNEIKYLCKVATAGSNEARALEKVKKTFEDAWRQNGTAQKNTTNEGGVKYLIRDNSKKDVNPEGKTLKEQLEEAFDASQSKERKYVYIGDFTQDFIDKLNKYVDIKNYPVVMNYRDAYLSMESKENGKYQGQGINYHNLGVEGLESALMSFDVPEYVMLSPKEGKIELVLESRDYKNRQLISIVEINTKAQHSKRILDAHVVVSVYGKNGIKNRIEKAEEEGRVIYNKNEESSQVMPQVQYERDFNDNSSKDIISNPLESVNGNLENPVKSEQFSLSDIVNVEQFLFDDDFYSRFAYEDKSIINQSEAELQAELKEIDDNYTDDDYDRRFSVKTKLNAVRNGYRSEYDYWVGEAKKRKLEDYKANPQKYERLYAEQERKKERQKQYDEAIPLKREQFDIIQANNPMWDDFHTGIRSVEDIHTWEEVLQFDDEYVGQFLWGDFSREDAEKALKENSITIYSSYPIKNGTFVSTSYIQAREYAGGKPNRKVYSKTIPLNEVAWINADEGQYAKAPESKNSLSEEGPQATEHGTYNVYGNDIAYTEDIGPVRDDIPTVKKSTDATAEFIGGPVREDISKAPQKKSVDVAHGGDVEGPVRDDIPVKPQASSDDVPANNTSPDEEPVSITTVKERLEAKLSNATAELENNKKLREESINRFNRKIADYQEKYEAKKNKDTKIANDILRSIERLKNNRDNNTADFDKRINDIEKRIGKITEQLQQDHTKEDNLERSLKRIDVRLEREKAAAIEEFNRKKGGNFRNSL